MSIQPTKKQIICLVSAALVLTLVGVGMAPTALAKIATNAIDPVAIVTDNGRQGSL